MPMTGADQGDRTVTTMNGQGPRGLGRWLGLLTASLAWLVLVLTAAACSQGPAAAAHSASPSSAAKLKVTSTLDGLTALPHRIHWQAFRSGDRAAPWTRAGP